MLDKHEISIGCLFTYLGYFLGLGLLALSLADDDLARWGIAVLGLACTYSLHRALVAHDQRFVDAFQMGRDYERSNLTALR